MVHMGVLFYGPCQMCLKVAILLDWKQLFRPTGVRDLVWWSIQGLIWSNVVFYTVGEFAEIFQCFPAEKIWNVLYPIDEGSCAVDISIHTAAAVMINLLSDLAILALPNWVIWRMKLSLRRKVGVSLLFTVGLLVCIFGALRLMALLQLRTDPDFIYWMSILALFSSAEIGIGFLIMGLPSTPRVVMSIPVPESLRSLICSVGESAERWTKWGGDASPTWRRSRAPAGGSRPARRRGVWSITELDETEAVKTRGAISTVTSLTQDTASGDSRHTESALVKGASEASPKGGPPAP